MKSEVYVAATEPAYGTYPYADADDPTRRALDRLWSAWGRDRRDPVAGWIGPGAKVVIKPNWVMDANPRGHDIESLITHTSLIRHVLDACATAMKGTGTIVVGDAPLQGCHFETLLRLNRMTDLVESFRASHPELNVAVQDWRRTVLERQGKPRGLVTGPQIQRDADTGAAVACECVDRGRDSFLEEIADRAHAFRVTDYKPSRMHAHHRPGKHEYLVVKCIREADLLINLPKLKTHTKTGLSAALKNLVGVNALKECLPHHIRGAYLDGGDAHWAGNVFSRWADRWYDAWWEAHGSAPAGKRYMYALVHRLLRAAGVAAGSGRISFGSWSGNETLWRTILDLNHVVYFGQKHPGQVITIVDGIVAGEGNGPLSPSPKPAGLLVAGENPACIDAVLAQLMGYDLARLPMVYHALTHRASQFGLSDVRELEVVRVGDDTTTRLALDELPSLNFKKPRYWRRAAAGCRTDKT